MTLLLLLAASLVFAVIVAIPDLLVWWRHPRRWVPVNSPPYSLSDDYHYFSVLNIFHRSWFGQAAGEAKTPIRLSAASWLSITTLLFNVLPYHLGYVLTDRRGGIVTVRMWNHAVFFFATAVTAELLFRLLGVEASAALLVLIATLHYVSYPTLLTFAARGTILFNLRAADHIYQRGQPNDISRAFNLGTSGALFMLAVAWLLVPEALLPGGGLRVAVAMGLNALLYFSYLPIACVYGLLCVVDFAVTGPWYVAAASVAVNLAALGVYFSIAARDVIMKEVVVHHDAGKLFAATKATLVEALAVMSAPLVIYLVTPDIPARMMALVCASGLCVLTQFLRKHQGSRFWDRGAILIFQLLLLTWAAAWLLRAGVLVTFVTLAMLAALTAALVRYEIDNTRQLVASRSKLAPEWIADLGFLEGKTSPRTHIVTDSVEIAYYTFLYTPGYSLLKNYSVQQHGYRDNLKDFCLNFKLAGYRPEEVVKIFSIRSDSADWMPRREQLETDDYARSRAVLYALQFMGTYHDFNQSLRDDGMYVAGEWTTEMHALIERIWPVGDDGRADYQLILDPHREVKRALAGPCRGADETKHGATLETPTR